MCRLSWNLGTSTSWNPPGLPRPVMGLLYLLPQHARIRTLFSNEQSPSLEANRFSARQETPPHFMEPEGSLPQSQTPATCSCPEPHQFSPFSDSTSWRLPLILSSQLRLGLPGGLFPSDFPTKIVYAPFLSPYALHAPPPYLIRLFIHSNNFWWGVQIIKLLVM